MPDTLFILVLRVPQQVRPNCTQRLGLPSFSAEMPQRAKAGVGELRDWGWTCLVANGLVQQDGVGCIGSRVVVQGSRAQRHCVLDLHVDLGMHQGLDSALNVPDLAQGQERYNNASSAGKTRITWVARRPAIG